MPLDREPIRVCPILWLFRFWVQESAFFVGRPFQAVKKAPEKTAWKGRPTPRNGRALAPAYPPYGLVHSCPAPICLQGLHSLSLEAITEHTSGIYPKPCSKENASCGVRAW